MRNRYKSLGFSQQAGLTLIELMIGLVLGLLILAAASATYIKTVQSSRAAEASSKMNETAAITLGILQQQIRLAAYSQIVGSSTYTIRKNFDGAGVRGCTGGFSSAADVAFQSIACNSTTTTPDALIIRYEASVNNTITANGNIPTNCSGVGIAQDMPSSATSSVALTAPGPYRLAENRYFIRSTGTPSGGPELYCAGASTTTTFTLPSPVMEGIEAMQITYGVANTPTGTVTSAYMSAQDIDTTFSATEAIDVRWKRVVSARVCIIVRSTDISEQLPRVADGATNQYFDCNNAAQTITDGRARRAYTTTVMLKNQLTRL